MKQKLKADDFKRKLPVKNQDSLIATELWLRRKEEKWEGGFTQNSHVVTLIHNKTSLGSAYKYRI